MVEKPDQQNMQGDELSAKRASVVDSNAEDHTAGANKGAQVASDHDALQQNNYALNDPFEHLKGSTFEEAQDTVTNEKEAVAASGKLADAAIDKAKDLGTRERMGHDTSSSGTPIRGANTAQDEKKRQEKQKKDDDLRRIARLANEQPIDVVLLTSISDFRNMAASLKLDIDEDQGRWEELSEFYENQDYKDYHEVLKEKLDAGKPFTEDERTKALDKIRAGRNKLGKDTNIDDNMSDADLVKLLHQTGNLIQAEADHQHGQMQAKIKIKEEFETIADKLQAIYDDNETYPSDEAKTAAYEKVMDEAKNDRELKKAIDSLDDEGLRKEVRGILIDGGMKKRQSEATNEPAAESNAEDPIPGLNNLDF
ncbi:hypothetical protein [Cerasicoccus frondis]|uniref:hypothetical protein n=1 Tax=Cerasicoccus frondis TaxID=490090 RepID=UPI0028527F09|nr:hypothetical protein [Cerasicoccus frondis]